jgi:hypothetical protein
MKMDMKDREGLKMVEDRILSLNGIQWKIIVRDRPTGVIESRKNRLCAFLQER